MIYNLIHFLRLIYTEVIFFPNESRVVNGQYPEKYCIIREYDGKDKPAYEDQYFQFKIYDVDSDSAKVLAEEIYYTMINNDARGARFNLTLPETNVNGIIYPAIETKSIQALQKPSFFETDENGRSAFIFNLWIIKKP